MYICLMRVTRVINVTPSHLARVLQLLRITTPRLRSSHSQGFPNHALIPTVTARPGLTKIKANNG